MLSLFVLHSRFSVLQSDYFVRVSFFLLGRNSDQLIPHMFNFLILLSYEKYHSKMIIMMPKIIQLCDGIMASGLDPTTHGLSSYYCRLINFAVTLNICIHTNLIPVSALKLHLHSSKYSIEYCLNQFCSMTKKPIEVI